MSRAAVITYNGWDEASAALAKRICTLLRESGTTPLVYGSERDGRIGADCTSDPSDCLCMITVGGDGTILHWGKLAARFDIPLLGVNTGRLGFMATLEPSDAEKIPELISGELCESPRMIMNVEIRRADGSTEQREALNDVVAQRDRSSKLPEFRVAYGSSEVSKIRADGMIFSTPTGSTAYALSAGGAIIAPEMDCIECTPLCPHTLFSRPMIFGTGCGLTLRCTPYQDSAVTISVDSESGIPFAEGDTLILTRSRHTLRLLQAGDGFFGAVRNKLLTPLK